MESNAGKIVSKDSPAATDSNAASPPALTRDFSLATLMLIVTLVAIVLGIFAVAPGVGILITIVLMPAMLRTAVELQRRRALGFLSRTPEKVALFAVSLGAVALTAAASAIAFGGPCWSGVAAGEALGGPEGYGVILLGAIVGGLFGAILSIWIMIRGIRALAPKDASQPLRRLFIFVSAVCILIAAALISWLFLERLM